MFWNWKIGIHNQVKKQSFWFEALKNGIFKKNFGSRFYGIKIPIGIFTSSKFYKIYIVQILYITDCTFLRLVTAHYSTF